LPEFASTRELVRFLDDPRVDLSGYDLGTLGEPVEVKIDKDSLRRQMETEYRRAAPLRPVTMRLDEDLIRGLKRIAVRRRMSYQTLARMWLRERAIEELRASVGAGAGAGKGGGWPQAVREQTRLQELLSTAEGALHEVRGLLRKKKPPR
jgi:hypothetical protein